jgi:hypothetical protein
MGGGEQVVLLLSSAPFAENCTWPSIVAVATLAAAVRKYYYAGSSSDRQLGKALGIWVKSQV